MKMSSTVYYSDEIIDAWNSGNRFSNSNAVYQLTKIGEHDQLHQLAIESKVLHRCLTGNHEACDDFTTTEYYKTRCGCSSHSKVECLSAGGGK